MARIARAVALGIPHHVTQRVVQNPACGAMCLGRIYKGFKGAQKDPIIGLDSAPLESPTFRAEVFEQLGEAKLEGALTTHICGMDEFLHKGTDGIRKGRQSQVERKH